MSEPLWKPAAERIAGAGITAFTLQAESVTGRRFSDYQSLHAWSVTEPETFWSILWDFCDLPERMVGQPVVELRDEMPGARCFPHSRPNFPQPSLARRGDSPPTVLRAAAARGPHGRGSDGSGVPQADAAAIPLRGPTSASSLGPRHAMISGFSPDCPHIAPDCLRIASKFAR